jgi:hypothetical protein
MSLISLLLGKSPRGTRLFRQVDNAEPFISLDATLREVATDTTEITEHEVEKREAVTDHFIRRPKRLTIDGVISNTPFTIAGQLTGIASSVGGRIGREIGGDRLGAIGGLAAAKTLAGVIGSSGQVRVSDVLREFELIQAAKNPITIITGLQRYPDYGLMSFTAERDQNTGDGVRVSLELKQIRFADSQTILVAVPKIKSALAKDEQGRQNTDIPNDEKNVSILRQFSRSLGAP